MIAVRPKPRPERPQAHTGSHELRSRLLQGISVEQRRITVRGARTVVLEAGAGPPLLLLHGGIECGGVYWAPVVARLSRRHRLIIPDVPGLGESEPFGSRPDHEFDAWLTALLRDTCAEKPALVAHSLLGTFAARYASRHGDRLDRLVIYGAPGIGPYRMPLGLMVTAIRFDLRPTARNSERFERWAFLDLERTRARDADWFDAFREYSCARARVPHLKRTLRALIRTGTTQVPERELQRIQVPVTLLWGRHDRMTPLTLALTASKQLGWPLRVIEDAGHAPHMEQPDAFVDAMHNDN